MIEFRTLGTLDLSDDTGGGYATILAQPKRVALLLYLCLQKPYGLHRRDSLIALFWPDSDQQHARNSLRNSVHALRRSLGLDAFHSRGDQEFGVRSDAVSCDARNFEELVVAGRDEEALKRYGGDLVPGFYIDRAPEFERWLDGQRSTLRTLAAKAARRVAQKRESVNRITDAISSAQKAVHLSPFDERTVRALIQLLLRSGDRAGALKVYEDFARQLREELHTEPSAETLALVTGPRAGAR